MIDEGEAESCCTVTQLLELPRALLRIVPVGAGIAIHKVALEHVIDEDGQLARRGRHGLRFPGAGGQSAVESPERRLGPPEAGRGEPKCRGGTIRRGLRLRAEELAPGHFVLRGKREPRGEVLRARPPSHVGANLRDELQRGVSPQSQSISVRSTPPVR